MKKALLTLLLFSLTFSLFGQSAAEMKTSTKKVNYGVKAGFTSSIYLVSNFNVGGERIRRVQNNYRVGFNGSVFMRINMKRHYIQPELAFNINKCEIMFDKTSQNEEGTPGNYASISSNIHSIDLPILYGYNFVQKGIFGMSFFVGPKIRYIWESQNKMKYSNFDQKNIKETFYPINFGISVGLAINISRVFFDFRYEQVLHNISKSIEYDAPQIADAEEKPLRLHRRDNTLSFSLGVIF